MLNCIHARAPVRHGAKKKRRRIAPTDGKNERNETAFKMNSSTDFMFSFPCIAGFGARATSNIFPKCERRLAWKTHSNANGKNTVVQQLFCFSFVLSHFYHRFSSLLSSCLMRCLSASQTILFYSCYYTFCSLLFSLPAGRMMCQKNEIASIVLWGFSVDSDSPFIRSTFTASHNEHCCF